MKRRAVHGRVEAAGPDLKPNPNPTAQGEPLQSTSACYVDVARPLVLLQPTLCRPKSHDELVQPALEQEAMSSHEGNRVAQLVQLALCSYAGLDREICKPTGLLHANVRTLCTVFKYF